MDLTGQKWGEKLLGSLPIPIIGSFSYPPCAPQGAEEKGTFPDPNITNGGCDPDSNTSGPNRFCDEFSVTGISPNPYSGYLIGMISPNIHSGIVCGQEIRQTYYVNACVFTSPSVIDYIPY